MKQRIAELLDILMGFRKTIVLVLLYLVAIIFRVAGLISGDNFTVLLQYTTVSYFGANSVEHFTSMVKDHLASKNLQQVSDADDDDAAKPGAK